MRARLHLLLATTALLGACRGEPVDVLTTPDAGPEPPIDSCELALDWGRTGDPCLPFGPAMECARENGCCIEEAFCESGTLFKFENCEQCGMCERDLDCPPGEWCIGEMCVPCEPFPEPPFCEPPLEPFFRNDCPTPECQLPTQCVNDEDCGDPGVMRCVRGLQCACEHMECCVNRCVEEMGCFTPEPPPEGCVRPAMDPMCMGGFAVQVDCQCMGDQWICNEVCTEQPGPSC